LLLLIWYNAMDTKDNMARRNLVGNTKCLPWGGRDDSSLVLYLGNN
jgi:hypothetical protein